MQTLRSRSVLLVALVCLAGVSGTAGEARAQSFVSPLIGYNFGGDSGCPTITNCEDKQLNFGIGVGRMGDLLGAETEINYARHFFGDFPGGSSSLLTWMGNVMVVPNFGPLRPYGTVGIGLMRTRVELDVEAIMAAENQIAWNVGGGAMVLFSRHVGVRGDIRYFHSLQELPVVGFDIGGERLDFGRASAALMLRF